MSDYAHIPAYDPEAASKILNLKEVFAGVDRVFAPALPESRRNQQEIYGIPNPHGEGVYSRLRRAWLSGFNDLEAFKADIFPVEGFHNIETPLERRLRKELRELFLRRMALPYGQPSYAVHGPVFEGKSIFYGNLSFEHDAGLYQKTQYANEWTFRTFQIVEKAADRMNICYVRSSYNGLPVNIHHCADETVRTINRRFGDAALGLPVQLFLFSPKEGANGGPESFSLIETMQDGLTYPEVLPLDRLPPMIARLYYRHHARIQPGLTGERVNSPYMDFRGFSLRTMVPEAG